MLVLLPYIVSPTIDSLIIEYDYHRRKALVIGVTAPENHLLATVNLPAVTSYFVLRSMNDMKIMIREPQNDYIFSHFVADNEQKSVMASHIFIATRDERSQIAEAVFELLNEVYDELGGLKSFKDIDTFINDSYLWYITYDGPQPKSLDEFDINKVYVVSVFRQRYGLKGVAIARKIIGRTSRNKDENMILRDKANAALNDHIRFVCKYGWCEVSDPIEKKFYKLFGHKNVIDPYDLKDHGVFPHMKIDIDELHYWRPLRKGETSTMKIAYGTIKF